MADENSENEKPLVTFALFAYNQEQYIREAIEGAFSQTYEPLEIILSDDCSADRTFEIMQEMAAEYEGPHRVRVRKTSQNRGVFNHVLEVSREMHGHFMVLAAGDDVSMEMRTDCLVREWKSSGAYGICSSSEIIDANCKVLRKNNKNFLSKDIMDILRVDQGFVFVHGATSGYDANIFKAVCETEKYIFAEDGVLTAMIFLVGKKTVKLDDVLVQYRQHDGALSHAIKSENNYYDIFKSELRKKEIGGYYLDILDYFILEALPYAKKNGFNVINDLNNERVAAYRRYFSICRGLPESSLGERFHYLKKCREYREFRLVFFRLFGIKVFSLLKLVVRMVSTNARVN